jgi:hypothetical protein
MRWALGIVLLAFASPALAQCAEGREVGAETAGRCCWPAQRWNDARGRCEGPPACPEGWGAEGDACVAERTHDRPTIPWESPASSEFEDPTRFDPPPFVFARPRAMSEERTVSIRPMWISGLVLFSVSYAYSVISGTVFSLECCGANAWPMFIPIVGGLIWPVATNWQFRDWSLAFGIPGAAVQIGGVVLMILGIAMRRPVIDEHVRVGPDGLAITF